MNTSYHSRGFFNRLRMKLFGEADPIEHQLEEISRQGSGMARMAHLCSLALIVLFSLGSLVALGGDALTAIVDQWHKGQVDIPSAISVSVSTLLVLCMDVGMVYAASMLRLLVARRASGAEMRLHQLVMLVVALLEASTYAYMSARYEHPANLAVWSLILARAAAAPLLSVYLALARQLPVLPRDILYQVELASGKGVLRQVTELANNPEANLPELLSMFYASADMTDADRQRLSRLAQAVQLVQTESLLDGQISSTESDPTHPTGGGTPVRIAEDPEPEEDQGRLVALERYSEPTVRVPQRPAASATESSGKRVYRSYPSAKAEEAAAFALLDENGWNPEKDEPVMNQEDFRRAMKINNGRARALWSRYRNERRLSRITTPLVEEDVAQ